MCAGELIGFQAAKNLELALDDPTEDSLGGVTNSYSSNKLGSRSPNQTHHSKPKVAGDTADRRLRKTLFEATQAAFEDSENSENSERGDTDSVKEEGNGDIFRQMAG